jgi:hypothetical protein
LKTLS